MSDAARYERLACVALDAVESFDVVSDCTCEGPPWDSKDCWYNRTPEERHQLRIDYIADALRRAERPREVPSGPRVVP